MYFDERIKISDEKEKPIGKGAFQEICSRGKRDGYLHSKDRK